MYIKLRNTDSDENITGTVRMAKSVWQALRNYMHVPSDESRDVIQFPYGTRLVKQGYGWYRLINYRATQGVRKMKQAARIIRRFFDEQRKDITAEIKRLMRQATDAQLRVVAYSSPVANLGGDNFVLVKHVENKYSPTPNLPQPPSSHQIENLLSRFGSKEQRR
jgi:hypothetical protein